MAGKMTQTQIIAALAEKTNVSKKEAKEFLVSVADLAHKETKKNGEFTLPGLGKLVKQKRKARTGFLAVPSFGILISRPFSDA